MNQDLIERYLYAATKGLPRKQREDVAQELRGLIDDMLTERCGTAAPSEKDVRVVLTELGTPQELYAQYDEDGKKCLIGPPYYGTYKFVLKIVLAASAVGITIASLILLLMEPQNLFGAVTSWLAMVCNCLLASFAIVTLLFAFFQRRGVRLTESFNFDDLPPVPRKRQEISRWECIGGIGFCVLFVVLFLFVPQALGFAMEGGGEKIPMFNVPVLRETWYIILAFAVCGIVRETVQLLEGRYNRRVLTVALVTNLISAVLCVWWLTGFELMHPDFVANAARIFQGENDLILGLFRNFQYFFLGVILFALILDSAEATVKTLGT